MCPPQWILFNLVLLSVPSLVLGATLPTRVTIGAASLSTSTLSLWIAQEQGIFAKHGIEAQTISIRGGPTLVASLVAGDINVAFTSGVSLSEKFPGQKHRRQTLNSMCVTRRHKQSLCLWVHFMYIGKSQNRFAIPVKRIRRQAKMSANHDKLCRCHGGRS